MPFVEQQDQEPCPICGEPANVYEHDMRVAMVVNCCRCGDYKFESREVSQDNLPIQKPEKIALISYLIQQLNGALIPVSRGFIERPVLTYEFFQSLRTRSFPSPAEASDNLLLYIAKLLGNRPGMHVSVDYVLPSLAPSVGVFDDEDVTWLFNNVESLGYLAGDQGVGFYVGCLSGKGWERIAELRKNEEQSRFAFFARKFDNSELDMVYAECLAPAVRQTGFELRTATQKAGLIDAVIEDEIRRCAFLLADLSDDNAGAYWEAGFAEGLGKPVIYVVRAKDASGDKATHFDTSHRHTVRWDLASLDDTAAQLKAVIRNSLLGAAKQSDT